MNAACNCGGHSGASTASTGLRKTPLSAPPWVIRGRLAEMGKPAAVVLCVVAMVVVIVGVDFMFLRNRFWERLIVNVGFVLMFAAFYLRFFRPS